MRCDLITGIGFNSITSTARQTRTMKNHDVTLGWSNFAREYCRAGTGNSYSLLSDESVIKLTLDHWAARVPGSGETTLERKVLVRVPSREDPGVSTLLESLRSRSGITRLC